MRSRQERIGTVRNPSAGELRCPSCQGGLVREPRRAVDRLHNLLHPVRRYRCNSFACQWIGNLSSRRGEDANDDLPDGRPGDKAAGKRSSGLPAMFVLHMVLVAVGVVFVILFSSLEHSSWVAENAKAFDSTFFSAHQPSIRSVDAR